MSNIDEIFAPLLHKYKVLREGLGPYANGSGLNNLEKLSADHKISVVQKLAELKDIEDEISFKLSDYYVIVSELGTSFPSWNQTKYNTESSYVKSTVLISLDLAIPYLNEPLWISLKNTLSIKLKDYVPCGLEQKIKGVMRQDLSTFGFLAGLRFLYLGNYFNTFSNDFKMGLFIRHKDEISLIDFIDLAFKNIGEQITQKISQNYQLDFECRTVKPIVLDINSEISKMLLNNVTLVKDGLTDGIINQKMPAFFNGFMSNEENWIEVTQNLAKIELAKSLDLLLKDNKNNVEKVSKV